MSTQVGCVSNELLECRVREARSPVCGRDARTVPSRKQIIERVKRNRVRFSSSDLMVR
jgi:hypothetical protein